MSCTRATPVPAGRDGGSRGGDGGGKSPGGGGCDNAALNASANATEMIIRIPVFYRSPEEGLMRRLMTMAAAVLIAVTLASTGLHADAKRWWSYVEALANDGME